MSLVEILMDHIHNSRNIIVSISRCRDAPNSSILQSHQPVPHHDETIVGIAMKTIIWSVLYIYMMSRETFTAFGEKNIEGR
jgi:hypothetical protein